MSNKTFCDKCGKLIEKNQRVTHICIEGYDVTTICDDEEIDLCDECTKSFNNWLVCQDCYDEINSVILQRGKEKK